MAVLVDRGGGGRFADFQFSSRKSFYGWFRFDPARFPCRRVGHSGLGRVGLAAVVPIAGIRPVYYRREHDACPKGPAWRANLGSAQGALLSALDTFRLEPPAYGPFGIRCDD